MEKLSRTSLWSLERYAVERDAFRSAVIEHKKARRVALGPHATLLFEDFLTMKYQVQEMLRVERIFEPDAIEEEMAAYNPLIPDGSNWKATFLIEYEDVEDRAAALSRMPGVEHRVWLEIGDLPRTFAHANDDLDRSEHDKTAAVHFLRFELDPAQVTAVRAGATVTIGIDHDELRCQATLGSTTVSTLGEDLAGRGPSVASRKFVCFRARSRRARATWPVAALRPLAMEPPFPADRALPQTTWRR